MRPSLKLFMVLVGCRPKGRLTEQHDIFFGIGNSLKDLVPQMNAFWPGSGGLHIDAWREVTQADGFMIEVCEKKQGALPPKNEGTIFFINLGGYKENDFEEYHYKLLSVNANMAGAIKASKKTAFFKHTSLPHAGRSHVDDKFGIDVDDVMNVHEILSTQLKSKYHLIIKKSNTQAQDELHIGYLPFSKIK